MIKSKITIEYLEKSNKVLKEENQTLREEMKSMESTVETLLSYAKEK
tara:strand:- start:192 stop:332 length:141 start_codon:yes stop_codon:yes gene_type:complete